MYTSCKMAPFSVFQVKHVKSQTTNNQAISRINKNNDMNNKKHHSKVLKLQRVMVHFI